MSFLFYFIFAGERDIHQAIIELQSFAMASTTSLEGYRRDALLAKGLH
jgi:hypothetical protein